MNYSIVMCYLMHCCATRKISVIRPGGVGFSLETL